LDTTFKRSATELYQLKTAKLAGIIVSNNHGMETTI
jgi:hypothetical protein